MRTDRYEVKSHSVSKFNCKYSCDPSTERVLILNDRPRFQFWIVGISSNHLNPNKKVRNFNVFWGKLLLFCQKLFKIWLRKYLLFECKWKWDSRTIWIPDKWTQSCFLMYWSCFGMVGLVLRTKHIDRPYEYQTIWNPNFREFGIQIVSFQIPTVFRCVQFSGVW